MKISNNQDVIIIPVYYTIDESDKKPVLYYEAMEQEFHEKMQELLLSGKFKENYN